MILIATFDSTMDGHVPRYHKQMPGGPQRWFVELNGFGKNGVRMQDTFRNKKACTYTDLLHQLVKPAIEKMVAEGDDVNRMTFKIYKAR